LLSRAADSVRAVVVNNRAETLLRGCRTKVEDRGNVVDNPVLHHRGNVVDNPVLHHRGNAVDNPVLHHRGNAAGSPVPYNKDNLRVRHNPVLHNRDSPAQ